MSFSSFRTSTLRFGENKISVTKRWRPLSYRRGTRKRLVVPAHCHIWGWPLYSLFFVDTKRVQRTSFLRKAEMRFCPIKSLISLVPCSEQRHSAPIHLSHKALSVCAPCFTLALLGIMQLVLPRVGSLHFMLLSRQYMGRGSRVGKAEGLERRRYEFDPFPLFLTGHDY